MRFSFAWLLTLLCSLVTVCVVSGAQASTGSVNGVVLSATTNDPVTQGSVSLTINGIPWGATAAIDGSGNFDFGTVIWATSSTATCQVQTSGTGFIDAGATETLSPNGYLDFFLHLQPGSSISGTVSDTQANPPISGGSVLVYDANGVLLGSAPANAQGAYHYGGLVGGTYYARTDFPDYLDELGTASPA